MRIKLDLPQEIAEALESEGRDLSRTALEGLALEQIHARGFGRLCSFDRTSGEQRTFPCIPHPAEAVFWDGG
jgi:hypothetical protein